MTPFVRLEAIAAPLPLANVDTDQILPGEFLKTVSREGLGRNLFHGLRKTPGFILDREPWSDAKILIALDNFGCGSSREHAPWALMDFGIRCVIAPSFADIFAANCRKNGLLTVALPARDVETLLALVSDPARALVDVDLEMQTVRSSDGNVIRFAIDEWYKRNLLDGTDEVARTLQLDDRICAFEQSRLKSLPWLQRRFVVDGQQEMPRHSR